MSEHKVTLRISGYTDTGNLLTEIVEFLDERGYTVEEATLKPYTPKHNP